MASALDDLPSLDDETKAAEPVAGAPEPGQKQDYTRVPEAGAAPKSALDELPSLDEEAGPAQPPAPVAQEQGAGAALAGRILRDFPIVGQPVMDWLVAPGTAHVRSWIKGETYAQAAKEIEAMEKATEAAHPTAAAIGGGIGQVAGYSAAAVAAPAAFGIGVPSAVGAAARAGASNAIVALADKGAGLANKLVKGEKVTAEDVTNAIGTGALAGGLGAAGGAIASLFTRAIDPAIASMADMAINRFDIPLQASKISANPLITRLPESILPASRAAARADMTEMQAWYRAIGRELGEDGPVNAQVMGRAQRRIADEIDRLHAEWQAGGTSPELKAAAEKVRSQYDAMKLLEPLIEKNRLGTFTPQEFNEAAKAAIGDFSYGGGGRMGQLADIGVTFLKAAPAPALDRVTALRIGKEALYAAAAAGGHFVHHNWSATGAMLAVPAVAARVGGWVGRSTRLGNRLVRQAAEPSMVTTAGKYKYAVPGLIQQVWPVGKFLMQQYPLRRSND